MFLIPEDKRLSGTACLHVPESSAELAGNLRPDWVSLLVPVGKFAERARRPSRTTDTNDLTASLRFDSRRVCVGRVLNLCEDGMLVEGSSDLEVGEIAGFDFAGPGFRYVGFAAVAHRTAGSIGLRFVTWTGPVDRSIRALVAARLSSGQPGRQAADRLPAALPTLWNARECDRGAPSGLSIVSDASPRAAASRHRVLNVGEHGILIDGLRLPVGAQISFVLAGRDISRAGFGRVAYRTDTTAGVAVDHWHAAPEAIGALVSDETERRSRLEDADTTELVLSVTRRRHANINAAARPSRRTALARRAVLRFLATRPPCPAGPQPRSSVQPERDHAQPRADPLAPHSSRPTRSDEQPSGPATPDTCPASAGLGPTLREVGPPAACSRATIAERRVSCNDRSGSSE